MLAPNRKRNPFGDLGIDRGGIGVSLGSVAVHPEGSIITHICRDNHWAEGDPDHHDPRPDADDRERPEPRGRHEPDVEGIRRPERPRMYGRSTVAYDNNSKKRAKTFKLQVEASIAMSNGKEYGYRQPVLNHFTGQKKSIMELAAICGLTYKDGKVG